MKPFLQLAFVLGEGEFSSSTISPRGTIMNAEPTSVSRLFEADKALFEIRMSNDDYI